MIITQRSYPRAGLVGNPSDGYFGKTIALTFRNFRAEVILYETPELEILPNTRDHSRFGSIEGLVEDVRCFGYYGGVRLLKATIRRLKDHCDRRGLKTPARNFTIRYRSDIPHMVGLAGSSAIITACLRALMQFYDVEIPPPEQANLVLAVESEELRIPAGLQDRVAQVYQGLVYMDFDREFMDTNGHGRYLRMDQDLLPGLYIAYRRDLSEGSEIFHNNIRERFERGEQAVLDAMQFWSELTDRVRDQLQAGKPDAVHELLDANFDRRAELYKISEGNLRMIEGARSVGASAKFTGSGGAIIGTCDGDAMFEALRAKLEPMNIHVIRPDVAPATAKGTE